MLFVRLVFFCMSELNWLVIEVLLAAALVRLHSGDFREGKEWNTTFSLRQQKAGSADPPRGSAAHLE